MSSTNTLPEKGVCKNFTVRHRTLAISAASTTSLETAATATFAFFMHTIVITISNTRTKIRSGRAYRDYMLRKRTRKGKIVPSTALFMALTLIFSFNTNAHIFVHPTFFHSNFSHTFHFDSAFQKFAFSSFQCMSSKISIARMQFRFRDLHNFKNTRHTIFICSRIRSRLCETHMQRKITHKFYVQLNVFNLRFLFREDMRRRCKN